VRVVLTAIVAVVCAVMSISAQSDPRIQIDPATGRAIGAKETAPEDVKARLDGHDKVVIIDVRDRASFGKETLPGAINIPLEDLKGRLKEFSKDTLLVFT
jgi:3-mercaptopyruvate sulfurtransferase SseA